MAGARASFIVRACNALLACTWLLAASTALAADSEGSDELGVFAKLDVGPIYIEEMYDYYGADIRTFGPGIGASLLVGAALSPRLAIGAGVEASIAFAPFTLVEGYITSEEDHAFGFGVAGAFLDGRPIEDAGLRLHLLAGFAYSATDTPTTEVESAPGIGAGLGVGWDFAIDAALALELMLRASGSQSWDGSIAVSAYAVGLFLGVRYDSLAGR
jgi:hypothetical protein